MARSEIRLNSSELLAIDIGGANLKFADGKGFSGSKSFPLWQKPDQLAVALKDIISESPSAKSIAVTMTGELADCFSTKAEGVLSILEAVEQAADGRQILVYLCDGRLVKPETARSETLLAAASNWHVLATFSGRYCNESSGLLIDVGSTTADIIPIGPTGPQAIGRTDTERLIHGELVYTGVERSPVCAVVREFNCQGKPCPVAQELFATTLDAYLILDELAEEPDSIQTADGRARTKEYSQARLARMVCADQTMFTRHDAQLAAESIQETQLDLLEVAAKQVLGQLESQPSTNVISGQGEFLARRLVERLNLEAEMVSLTQHLGSEASQAACAHALAVLAGERLSE